MADSLRHPSPRSRFSVWTFVAPVALLACVSVIVVIAERAGWVGQARQPQATVVHHPRRHHHRPTSVTAVSGSNAPAATTTPPTTTAATTTSTTTTVPTAGKLFYAVQPGDSLASIANRFGTTVPVLRTLNPAVDPATLHPGQELRLR